MRRQLSMHLPVAALVLALGMVGCQRAPETPPPAEAQPTAGLTDATDATVAPLDEATPPPDGALGPVAQPSASGLAPTSSAPPAPVSASRPPATRADAPAAGVTPSPSIGGDPGATDAARETPAPRAAPTLARLVQLPAGTSLPVRLSMAVGSDTSTVEDPVTARVTRDVEVAGALAVPEGSTLNGRVTYVAGSGRVKGRAGLTVRFYTLTVGERTYDIEAEPLRREAEPTKGKDAQKIGIGAGAGAVVGGLLGGRKGAAIGAIAGGAGGTGVVLSTKGQEVHLPAGTALTVSLTAPLAVAAH